MADYNLDIKRPGCQLRLEGFHVGDCGLRELRFHFSEGGTPFEIPTSCIATLYAVLPDPEGTVVYSECDIIDNSVVYSLSSGGSDGGCALTALAGLVYCEIRLTTEGGVITSPSFSILVDEVFQNDGAIEARSEFSALNDALIRVLEAESGLSSKLDKTDGVEGNTVTFGPDGKIADSGTVPVSSFYLVYDDTGASDEENKASIKAILEAYAAEKPFAVFIKDYETIVPAHIEVPSNGCEISYEEGGYKSIIKYYKTADRIAYLSEDLYSTSFSETGSIPATQKATAAWVKSYVDSALLIDTEVIL